MAEWHIKEISDMTQTSIRMLRHYDKIGLLNPSYRASNGYRCYTEHDLATLQQIIALKYFGFSLSTIKAILQKHHNVYAHLQAQQLVLKEKSVHLQQVNDALGDILKYLSPSETPNWNDLMTLISRYRMTENLRDKLKKTWAQELNESQFEEYLSMYEQFPDEFAARDKIFYQVNNKELGDPTGPDGERAVRFMHDLNKKMKIIFTKQIKFNSSIVKDIQSGKALQLQATPEGALWWSRAFLSHWLKRWDELYNTILENVNADPKGKTGKRVADEWTGLISDYFSMGTSRSFMTGIILWQDLARQDNDIKELKTMLSPQEMVKKISIKLFFNPEATSWVSQALEMHAD